MARIMPPRRFKKKSVKRIVEKRVAKAIEEYEKTRADSNNTGGSGSANTGGTVAPEMHGSFICKCAEDDKVKFAMCTFEGRALTWWNGNVQTLGLANANQIPWSNENDIEHTTIASNELVLCVLSWMSTRNKKIEKHIRGFPEESKEKFLLKACDLHDSIQHCSRTDVNKGSKTKTEAAKVYVAAPAKGRGYAGNLPWCNRCKAHHQPGPCPPRCGKCHKLGHQEGECRTRIPVAGGNSLQIVTALLWETCALYMSEPGVKEP
ncbi:hypothetical protein Tco_0553012 [Tanacetum coccineum]